MVYKIVFLKPAAMLRSTKFVGFARGYENLCQSAVGIHTSGGIGSTFVLTIRMINMSIANRNKLNDLRFRGAVLRGAFFY